MEQNVANVEQTNGYDEQNVANVERTNRYDEQNVPEIVESIPELKEATPPPLNKELAKQVNIEETNRLINYYTILKNLNNWEYAMETLFDDRVKFGDYFIDISMSEKHAKKLSSWLGVSHFKFDNNYVFVIENN